MGIAIFKMIFYVLCLLSDFIACGWFTKGKKVVYFVMEDALCMENVRRGLWW